MLQVRRIWVVHISKTDQLTAHKHDLGITEIALQEMIGTFRRLIHLHIESFKEKYNKAMAYALSMRQD